VERFSGLSPLKPRFLYPGLAPGRLAFVGKFPIRPGQVFLEFPHGWDKSLLKQLAGAFVVETPLLASRPSWTRHLQPTHTVIAISQRPGQLSEAVRDSVWRDWGVPVLEQVMNQRGRVVASECLNRLGWHLTQEAELDHATCPCGSRQPLILRPEELPAAPENAILRLAPVSIVRMWRNWQTRWV
jgi:hypothetical protein